LTALAGSVIVVDSKMIGVEKQRDSTVAAVASTRAFAGLGIDVEPAIPLPPELVEALATPLGAGRNASIVIESRLLFAAKEAIYKAQHPIDKVSLIFTTLRSI
jgi:4'-phosphopantetheinyl transferase EntD